MHTEICPPDKIAGELNCSAANNNISVLEEDLALSSSTLEPRDKSLQEQPEVSARLYDPGQSLIYVNEETMDCSYSETAGTPKSHCPRLEVSSPEMFESDEEEDDRKTRKNFDDSSSLKNSSSCLNPSSTEKCDKPTNEELIERFDRYLLARMNKFLTGVPPPPKHTICQRDCADLLESIHNNREYFLVDPFNACSGVETTANEDKRVKSTEKILANTTQPRNFAVHRGKSSLRNLTNAFDACDRNDEKTMASVDDKSRENDLESSNDCRMSVESSSHEVSLVEKEKDQMVNEVTSGIVETSRSNSSTNEISKNVEKVKHVTFKMPGNEPERHFNTIDVENVKNLSWEFAYKHKAHGIHYNRSKNVEEFEDLTLKLCQRYIGAETQTSCNVWFTKQAPSSVKKRNILLRRANGQSPGKRLSHLARRRRTFSSANLQVLGMADKKQLVLNIKKPTMRKGKSPRGKSPRGKSPRGKSPRGKSPRGSARKRAALSRISPSPRKTKLETSKRALFQSPPGDRAGPSNRQPLLAGANNPQQRIKRALFASSKTKDEVASTITSVGDIKRVLNFEETKKRKSEDELEGPRYKWAKSLSFDCPHVNSNNSGDSWNSERYSTGTFHMKSENPLQPGKSELSEIHRKKLLWAVAEALRGKGIGMGHPRFKQCASQLARTVKKYMPDLENTNVPRKPGSTSDRMLRLAKRHVLLIVETKSTE